MIFSEFLGIETTIISTDIDQNALNEAKLGIYPTASALYPCCFESIPSDYFTKYLLPTNTENYWRVADVLNERIDWRNHNLLLDPPPLNQMDLICCRNVLMYFSIEHQHRILISMVNCLRIRKGILLLGVNDNEAKKYMSNLSYCEVIDVCNEESPTKCLWKVTR